MSFKDLTKEKVYAVVKYRYVTLSAVQAQVIVATLWSGTEFQWSDKQTQEVWGVKVLKDFLIGDCKKELPFWIAVPPEKVTPMGSYYPLKAMAFTEKQLGIFEWARQAREMSLEGDEDRDESMSVFSANTGLVTPQQWGLPPVATPRHATRKRARIVRE